MASSNIKVLPKSIGNILGTKVLAKLFWKSIANIEAILEKVLPIVLQYKKYCNINKPVPEYDIICVSVRRVLLSVYLSVCQACITICVSVCVSGVVPNGDMPTVCQSEAVLPQQLADLPHPVSRKAARPRLNHSKSGFGVAVQAALVQSSCLLVVLCLYQEWLWSRCSGCSGTVKLFTSSVMFISRVALESLFRLLWYSQVVY